MSIFKGSILIVDDDTPAREMLFWGLSRECYHCVAVMSGLDALDKCAACHFDVIILNVALPWTPLSELLPSLIRRCPETQFIMVESTVDREAIEEGIRLGACDYVTKPLDISDVLSRVERAMARRKQPLKSSTSLAT